MSVEENKALVRRYFEEIDRSTDADVLDEFVSAEFVDHSPLPGCAADLEGFKAAYRMFASGAPGTHRVDDVVAEGDKVVVRVFAEGVHSGELFGVPATNRKLTMSGIAILRIVDGRIVEHWMEADSLGVLQQLGVIPA